MAYTPLQSGQTPTLGSSGQAVSDLQRKLNSVGANLNVDSLYGPQTEAAFKKYGSQFEPKRTVPSPTVFTGNQGAQVVNNATQAVSGFDSLMQGYKPPKDSGDVGNMFSSLDSEAAVAGKEYQTKLDQIANGTIPLSTSEQAILNSIKRQAQLNHAEQEKGNQAYMKGLEVAGIRSGRSQYAPEVQSGIIKNAIDINTTKLQELDLKASEKLEETRQNILDGKAKAIKESYNAYTDAIKERKKTLLDLQRLSLDQQKFLQSVKNQNARLALAAKSAASSNKLITEETARQAGLPPTVVGMSEKQMLQSLSFTEPPSWFYNMTEDQSNIGEDWDAYRSDSDIQALISAIDPSPNNDPLAGIDFGAAFDAADEEGD